MASDREGRASGCAPHRGQGPPCAPRGGRRRACVRRAVHQRRCSCSGGSPLREAAPTRSPSGISGTTPSAIALVGLYLAPFAGIAFLWFIAVIRSHLGDREDQFFATVFLGSGLLFVAMLFAAAAAAGAPLAAVKFQGAPLPSPDAIGLARALAYTFLYVYGVRVGCGLHDRRLDARASHGEPPAVARRSSATCSP